MNRGSAAALSRAIWALWSVEPSSTMITSRSANDWAAMESRQSARSSSLLKNATTTLILGVFTGSSSLLVRGGDPLDPPVTGGLSVPPWPPDQPSATGSYTRST